MVAFNGSRTFAVYPKYDKKGYNLVIDLATKASFYLPMSIISSYTLVKQSNSEFILSKQNAKA